MRFLTIIAVFLFSVVPAFAGETTFEYDELNRLIKVTYEDGITITYTYDKVGNRQVKDVTSPVSKTSSSPPALSGPGNGTAEVPYSFSSGGSSYNFGHLVQHLFD